MESLKRPWPLTSSAVRLQRPTIFLESLVPSVMPKLRSLACSKPGTHVFRAWRAYRVCWRPSISARVKSSASVGSTPLRWTRFRFVASPASLSALQEPPKFCVNSLSGMAPLLRASSNSVSKYGLRRLSSLPDPSPSCAQVRLQSLYVLGLASVYSRKRCLSTPEALKTAVTPRESSLGQTVYWAPARWAMSASPVQSTTHFASIAWRPDLLSVMTPRMTPPSTIASTATVWRSGRMPLCMMSLSATTLKKSASRQGLSL
mmetsp:Transcript_64183/g.166854  ORF Transcript_64183/g.166854 Transcript_64183/m.166854 type:complete len:260 (-) Transcript_64183:550-1329(-)